LPLNPRDGFLTVPAHCSIRNFPTSVEPVKVNLRTIGLEVSRRRSRRRPNKFALEPYQGSQLHANLVQDFGGNRSSR
jgi:hypothetical protein